MSVQNTYVYCAQFPWGKKKKETENVYLFLLYLKWEKSPTSNSTLVVIFVFKPVVENDTVEYVSMLYHYHNQMTQKEKERSSESE